MLSIYKCFVLHISSNNHKPVFEFKIDNHSIPYANDSVRDLGVYVSSNLSSKDHISRIKIKTAQKTGLIFRCFRSRNANFLKDLYLTYVRPHAEYASPIWNPYQLGDIRQLESIQRHFTSRIPSISHLNYPQRLDQLKIVSLEQRRIMCDLIELYKIITGRSVLKFRDYLEFRGPLRTRTNHELTLKLRRYNTSIGLNSFFARTSKIWNMLPEEVVNSKSVEIFKDKISKLDLTQHLKCFPKDYT
jgi:ribonuclease P/MRP protein subunit RPP40